MYINPKYKELYTYRRRSFLNTIDDAAGCDHVAVFVPAARNSYAHACLYVDRYDSFLQLMNHVIPLPFVQYHRQPIRVSKCPPRAMYRTVTTAASCSNRCLAGQQRAGPNTTDNRPRPNRPKIPGFCRYFPI